MLCGSVWGHVSRETWGHLHGLLRAQLSSYLENMILNIKKCFSAGTALVSLGDNMTCCGYYITGDELSCPVFHVSRLLSDAVCAGDSSVILFATRWC